MKQKNAIIIITADPRVNGRAAEGIRIAVGTGGWDKVRAKVCLVGEARSVLAETVDDLVDGEVVESYLPGLVEGEGSLLVLAGDSLSGCQRDLRYSSVPQVTVADLAQLCREADFVLRF